MALLTIKCAYGASYYKMCIWRFLLRNCAYDASYYEIVHMAVLTTKLCTWRLLLQNSKVSKISRCHRKYILP